MGFRRLKNQFLSTHQKGKRDVHNSVKKSIHSSTKTKQGSKADAAADEKHRISGINYFIVSKTKKNCIKTKKIQIK